MSNEESPRIAVVFIHGIGEPRPMETLRGFVDAVASVIGATHVRSVNVHSVPLEDTELFDSRRLVLVTPSKVRVDFLEFYWAHLAVGTTFRHAWRWLCRILFRKVSNVPQSVRLAWAAAWIVVVTLASCACIATLLMAGLLAMTWSIAALLALVIPIVLLVVLGTGRLFEAGRYLDPVPSNVIARHAIRRAGVDLLKKLHQDDLYERIVVVGHSLGTVIGLDMLHRAWLEIGRDPAPVSRVGNAAERALTDALETGAPVEHFQSLQLRALSEFASNGGKWRISDFITLGSPLAHADILLAANLADLRRRQLDLELPSCPPLFPVVERMVKLRGGLKKVLSPYDAFHFTRWTNIYSPSTWLVRGDLISGPVGHLFGSGVRDIGVGAERGLLTHLKYWAAARKGHEISYSLRHLMSALNLDGPEGLLRPIGAVSTPAASPSPPSRKPPRPTRRS